MPYQLRTDTRITTPLQIPRISRTYLSKFTCQTLLVRENLSRPRSYPHSKTCKLCDKPRMIQSRQPSASAKSMCHRIIKREQLPKDNFCHPSPNISTRNTSQWWCSSPDHMKTSCSSAKWPSILTALRCSILTSLITCKTCNRSR